MEKSIQNIPNLTVLILTAGYGRRMGMFSRMVNKSLIPYNNKPLISHIIDRFPDGTKFVVAVGHQANQVEDYISLVHEDKDITLVEITDYSEGYTGPGTTIRKCSAYLPESFMWISCDTLFDFDFSDKLDHNWIAVHPIDSKFSKDYCWISRDGDKIEYVFNKIESDNAVDAFIGLMYVKDGKKYIDSLNKYRAKEVYEGFADIELKAHTVSRWLDFGTYNKWKELNDEYPEVSFPKPDELFYHDNNKIIKFSTNADLTKSKYLRASINPKCMPQHLQHRGDFLCYEYEKGTTLYDSLTIDTFASFLNWVLDTLWTKETPDLDIYDASLNFYRTKTLQRIDLFRAKYSDWNEFPVVNGLFVNSIAEYLNKIDFDWLSKTSKAAFIHGDMQPENIIYNNETESFTAIDWRSDFSGQMAGDIYYDIAKLAGGLYLSYKEIKSGRLLYEENNNSVRINIPSVHNHMSYINLLKRWTIQQGLDWRKVQILIPIIYLNMAPLHEAPFDKYLIALSQYFFGQVF